MENEKMKKCSGINCSDEIYKAGLCYEHYRKYIHHQLNGAWTAERVGNE